jgi:hypothetical protein
MPIRMGPWGSRLMARVDRYFSQRMRHPFGPGMPPIGRSVFAVRPREYESPSTHGGPTTQRNEWGYDWGFFPFATPNRKGRVG